MNKDEKTFFSFSVSLLELLESEIPLKNSLEVLSAENSININVKKMSTEILEKLSEGFSFSSALNLSSFSIKERYLTLISASESGGSLIQALKFIKEIFTQKKELEERIKSVSLYPSLVVSIALAATFVLLHFRNEFLVSVPENELYSGVFTAIAVLFAGIGAVALYIKKAMGENTLYSVFFALSFLSESGFDFSNCLDIAIMYSVQDKEINKALLNVKTKIQEGEGLGEAFSHYKIFPKEIVARLSLAEIHGNIDKVTRGIAKSIEKKDVAKRNQCMQLIEPLLILCTGLYILILVETIVLPFLTSFGGI